jgi:hypothetical protein
MSAKPKRKNFKGPGKCIFCGGGAVPGNPMAGEHLWSDWMDKAGLLRRVSREYIQSGENFRRYTSERTVVRRSREGSPHYSKIKAVCKSCNSGWMGAIEEAAKPILTPLIKGQRIVLTRQMRLKLIQWIVLKLLVAEHSQQAGYEAAPIYNQADRDAFMSHRKTPDFLRVYLGRHKSITWGTGYHRRASGLGFDTPSLPPPKNSTAVRNVQATTWGIGSLLIYISGVTDAAVAGEILFVKDPALRRLWPLISSDLRWPPAAIVDGPYIDDLANSLSRFLDARMAK